MHLCRGAVDFVGEDQIGKNRAAVGSEGAVLGRKNHRPDDVAWQQVGGELNAVELHAKRGTERLDEQCLGQAGHALEEDMTIGQQRDEQALDNRILADDGLADFFAEFLGPGGSGGHKANEMRQRAWCEGNFSQGLTGTTSQGFTQIHPNGRRLRPT